MSASARVFSLLALLAALLVTSCAGKAPYEGKSVAQLQDMLTSSDTKKQVQGAYGLSLHGARASPAVPALIEQLRSSDVLVRETAAMALGKIGPDARDAVPALIGMLSDSNWRLRRQAAMALGEIGPDARAAVPDLQRRDRDLPIVRKSAEEALTRIDPDRFSPKKK
jgi:HEAT repeat protein